MHKNQKLWSAVLAMSLSIALALPVFAQGQSGTSQSYRPGSTPSTDEGAMESEGAMGSSGRVAKTLEDEAATVADQALNQRIRQALSEDRTLVTVVQKVHLDTDNGKVTLHGSVETDEQKADIATKVQQVAGVKKVDNQLRTAMN
jgi:osmotically-inducible protein OsmY